MVLNRAARISVAILLVSGAIGCNSDRGYAPPDTVLTDHQVSTDVAISEGEAAAADLASLTNTTDFAGGNFSVQIEPARNVAFDLRASLTTDCTYAAGRWSCPPSMEDGLTITRSYAFFDAAGQAMKVRDDLTTALVNFQYSVNGAVFRDTTFSEVVHRAQNVTVSGLLGAETTRRWDGVGTSADTNTHRSALTARTYAGTSVDSLKALIYPQPRTSSSYPLSGATVRVVKYLVTSRGRGTERRSVERRVVTTYNGTATVQVQSGSISCTLHLDSHKVDGCSG